MKKDSKLVAWYLFLLGVIYIVNYFIKTFIRPSEPNASIYYKSGAFVVICSLLGYILYAWKCDFPELLKRFARAIPFALLFSVLVQTLEIARFWAVALGIMLCLVLLFKTPNWRQHFFAILIPAYLFIICSFLMSFFVDKSPSAIKTTLFFAGMAPFLSFSTLYFAKLLESDEAIELKPILYRAIKFSIAASLFFTASLLLGAIGDEFKLELPIKLLMGILAAVLFFMICHRYDLFLDERNKTPKQKSGIRKIQNKLEEFYLNERAKADKSKRKHKNDES